MKLAVENLHCRVGGVAGARLAPIGASSQTPSNGTPASRATSSTASRSEGLSNTASATAAQPARSASCAILRIVA